MRCFDARADDAVASRVGQLGVALDERVQWNWALNGRFIGLRVVHRALNSRAGGAVLGGNRRARGVVDERGHMGVDVRAERADHDRVANLSCTGLGLALA